jgi:hypothetical protein
MYIFLKPSIRGKSYSSAFYCGLIMTGSPPPPRGFPDKGFKGLKPAPRGLLQFEVDRGKLPLIGPAPGDGVGVLFDSSSSYS